MTSDKLSVRFNGHRSDVTYHPNRCELPQHYATNNCDINNDLRISILEHVKNPSWSKLLLQEDKWICRLKTAAPEGMNGTTSEFGYIHRTLFNNK